MDWSEPLSIDFWLRIGVAFLCGAVIGIERQLRGKPAGIRTSVLVCMGTMVFVRLGADTTGGDPNRVLAQVVSGVGFLGAGLMLARDGLVTGVTSAAVIWVLAAIGAAIGLNHYASGIVLAVVTVVVLTCVQYLERAFVALRKGVHADADEEVPEGRASGVPWDPKR